MTIRRPRMSSTWRMKRTDEKAAGADAATAAGDAAPAEGEDDGSPWELAPPKVGGAPAVIDAFHRAE